jgi:molybdopterin converting factor small subunit
MVNVLLFGRLAEVCGQTNIMFDMPDTDAVCEKIRNDFPEMKQLSFAIAVNQLKDGDEVALMPPYSGG